MMGIATALLVYVISTAMIYIALRRAEPFGSFYNYRGEEIEITTPAYKIALIWPIIVVLSVVMVIAYLISIARGGGHN